MSNKSNKLSKVIAVLICAVFAFSLGLSFSQREVYADGTVEVGMQGGGDADHQIFYINSWGYGSDVTSITVTVNLNHSADGLNEPWGASGNVLSLSGEYSQNITVKVKPNKWVAIEVSGTNIDDLSATKGNVSVQRSSAAPTTQATTAPTTRATTAPTARATTAATQAPTQATTAATQASTQATTAATQATTAATQAAPVVQTTAATQATTQATQASTTTAATTEAAETTQTEAALTDGETEETTEATLVSAVGEVVEGETYDETVVMDETHEDGTPVVMGFVHVNPDQVSPNAPNGKASAKWLWFILPVLLAGAAYFRYRNLKNKGMGGKDIALNFVPGTSGVVYAIGNLIPSKQTVSADASSAQKFNQATAMKELRQMEEANAREDAKMHTTQHAPIKRPKELSVNRAQAVSAAPSVKAAPTQHAPIKRPKELSVNRAAQVSVAAAGTTAAAKTRPAAQTSSKTNSDNPAVIAARQRAEAAKAQIEMRKQEEARKNNEDKLNELKQRPPIKRPKNLSVNAAQIKAQQTSAAAPAAKETVMGAGTAASVKAARELADMKAKEVAKARQEAERAQQEMIKAAIEAREAEERMNSIGAVEKTTNESVYVPREHKKTGSDNNQLGSLMNGKVQNSAARAPVWAAPGMAGINPFKSNVSEEPASEVKKAETKPSASEQTHQRASIADQTTKRSAFFDRAKARAEANEAVASAYGGIVRPSAIVDDERDTRKTQTAPAMGAALEGQRPAIMNNGTDPAPTATRPLAGFKGSEENV